MKNFVVSIEQDFEKQAKSLALRGSELLLHSQQICDHSTQYSSKRAEKLRRTAAGGVVVSGSSGAASTASSTNEKSSSKTSSTSSTCPPPLRMNTAGGAPVGTNGGEINAYQLQICLGLGDCDICHASLV